MQEKKIRDQKSKSSLDMGGNVSVAAQRGRQGSGTRGRK